MNNSNLRRNLLISSGVSMLVLLISAAASYMSINQLLSSNEWVSHTLEVLYNLNKGQTTTNETQNTVRGFIITGKTAFLDQYGESEEKSQVYFDKVLRLTIDNPRQRKNLAALKPLRQRFFKYLAERVEQRRNGQLALASNLVEGKNISDQMHQIYGRMEAEENRLLSIRQDSATRYASYSVVLIVTAAVIAILLSALFLFRILNDFKERTRLSQELHKKDIETAERIKVISGIAGQISDGNYSVRVDDTESDALGSVAESLNNMASALDSSFKILSDNEWLQAGVARLNNAMIGEKTMAQLTKDILNMIAGYTSTNAAVLYLAEGNDLTVASGYSYKPGMDRERLKVGEGFTGEAASSGKIMELKGINADAISISYALGEIMPSHIVAIPLIEDSVEGVLEMASLKEYSARDMQFFGNISNNIGIALKAAKNRARVQELLEETQAQSEELRAQHNELEGMNAELEAQTEKLQASEEELRVQQEELQQTNEELAERSVLLEERNTEIQKKSEDLERTTRYKSEFLANMSHELRTPLNSILLLSRLLSENNESNLNEEQVEFAKVIQSSGNGLLGLIDEILDLSKIEAGKMDLEFLDVAVEDISRTIKSLFSEVAKEKNIELKVSSADAPLVIRTDRMRLEQIIKNLLSNAIKFTEKGSVTLEIKKDPASDKRVIFRVTDTGIGIPQDKQPLIFEAFQQADGSTKRKYGGTGLGLSISRELTKLLRGELALESEAGKGSTFTLSIPIVGFAGKRAEASGQTSEKDNQQPAATESAKRPYISTSIPEDIPDDRDSIGEQDKVMLIVEDDTAFAKSLLEFTRKRGYKGVVSVRGDHALNLAMVYRPAGILLDIELPMKNGWEVMEELKNNSQTKHIPVHIMSSHKLRQESMLKGAVNFLDKPVAYEMMPEIFKRIEHIVSKESQKVLIIEDNPKHAKALAYFLETYNINSEIKSEISDGVESLKKNEVDCVILDMGIPDKQAYEILDNVKKSPGLENLPVIVFTGKSLSMQEERKIKQYADSIIVKTAHSYQRMIDEVSLFLHLVEDNKKGGKMEHYRKLGLLNNILSDKTVLIVDDDVRNIYSLTKALESLKMNVITAIDGKEALKVLESNPETDLVLLDMMMPNMDGYETATRIRQNRKYKSLPVIAVTAKAMTGDREKCINAGASDYITKPVDIDQLLSLLRVWLYEKS